NCHRPQRKDSPLWKSLRSNVGDANGQPSLQTKASPYRSPVTSPSSLPPSPKNSHPPKPLNS
ncbi:MAG: hypothetical protein AAF798_08700, partial [Bacteroidota bacterium]